MNICIMVHSQTGTSLQFAQLLSEKLISRDNLVDLVELKTNVPVVSGSVKNPPKFEITNLPDFSKYEILIAGGPVWALSASPVIYKAISLATSLRGKIFIPFVVLSTPLASMGGSKALKVMSQAAEKLGAKILEGIILTRLFNSFDTAMASQAERICLLLK